MRRWRTIASGVLIIGIAMPLIFTGSMYASAWYYRWRAGQLLAVIKAVTPGVTTEAEYIVALKPLEPHLVPLTKGDNATPVRGGFGLENRPAWVGELIYSHLPEQAGQILDRMMPFATIFLETPTFVDGKLSGLEVQEEQGSGHPFGAFVTISATGYENRDPASRMVKDGYYASHLSDDLPLWETFVSLDERATTIERAGALNFQFRCFTRFSMCRDAALYLQPQPNR